MQTVVGGLLTLSGLGVLAFLLVKGRADAAANLGGAGPAAALIGTAVAANVAGLLPAGLGSATLGACAAVLFAYGVLRAGRGTVLGGPDPLRRLAWAVAGALIAWSGGVDLAMGAGITDGRLPAYAGGVLIWVAAGLLAGTCAVTVRGLGYVGLTLLSAMTIPTIAVPSWWTGCHVGQLDKCSVVGALFRGAAESENYVAFLASLTAVATQVGFQGRTRVGLMAFCLLVLACTGSRTGMVTVAVMWAYCLVAQRWDRHRPRQRMSVRAAAAISSTAVLTAVCLVYTAVPGTLSRRGSIWIAVREALDGWLLTGVGLSRWGILQDTGQSPQHFFHSSYAMFLFAGGAVAVALFWLWSYLMLRASAPAGRARSWSAPVVLVLLYSQTETIWNPLAVDGLTWIFVCVTCGGLSSSLARHARLSNRPRRNRARAVAC